MEISRAALRARLAELVAQHDVPGAVVGVWHRGDVVTAAAGVLNRRTGVPVTEDSVFQIGSITKVWTATLVMQLVDEGLVDLDCPVQHYVPEFTCADPDAARVITVRQLLCHTSGVDGDFFEDFGRGDECLDRYVRGMSGLPLVAPPGAVSSYCNAGYVVLGRLVERLRDLTFDDAVRRHLTEPLGLEHTVTLPEDALVQRAAVGHVPSPGGAAQPAATWSLPRALGPAGLITCSVGDLLSFAAMHLDEGHGPQGREVLAAWAVNEMQRRQAVKPDAPRGTVGGGLGWVLSDWGTGVAGHDGGTIGQYASLRIVPEHRFACAVLTNGGGGLRLAAALLDEVCRVAVDIGPPPPTPGLADGLDLAPLVGTYARTGARVEVTLDDSGQPQLAVRSEGVLAMTSEPPPPQPLVMTSPRTGRTIYPDMDVELGVAFSEPHPAQGFELLHLAGRVHRRTPQRTLEESLT
ncbi:MAG: hypothetical protein QOE05_3133 [Actinomycetota bacterium]|jgi:CubicO group peptidase (beta-lactamase class C family)|nr:hypothetical protein [Actinomycetota bacterium]